MSVKERLSILINLMDEECASGVEEFIMSSFKLKPVTWDDIEEDEPTEDEIQFFAKAREEAREEYLRGETVSHNDIDWYAPPVSE
jgi:hypothetical protein